MFNRIKTLMLLQLSDHFKIKKVDSVPKLLAKIGLALLGLVLITAVCILFLYFLHSNTHLTTAKTLSCLITILQGLSIVACTNSLLKTLYTSKDNPILLSYPAHHVEVFLSKLLVYYVYEFIKSVFFIIPVMLSFGIIYGYIDFLYVINSLVLAIILPIFPVLIGALITIPLLYIQKLIDKFPILKTILLVIVLIGVYGLLVLIVYNIERPLQIVEMFNKFKEELTYYVETIDKYSLYYHNVGNILTTTGVDILLNYLCVILVLAGLIGGVALISMPLYFTLASKSSEQATEKKRKGVNVAHKNSFITFLKKEWLLSIRNFGEFLNNYIFIFATPYVLFLLMGIYTAMGINSLGVYLIVAFSGFVTLMMSCASNTSSALAITKEGSEFVLLKTVPSNSSNMVWAKLFYNLVFSTIMIALGYILVINILPLFNNTIYDAEHNILWEWQIENNMLWSMMVASILVNAAMVFWSIQIDIMNPKLREYASSGDTSSMNNASKSIMIGVIVAVLFTLIVVLVLIALGNVPLTWIIVIGIAAIFLLIRLYLFVIHLKYVFPYIEY